MKQKVKLKFKEKKDMRNFLHNLNSLMTNLIMAAGASRKAVVSLPYAQPSTNSQLISNLSLTVGSLRSRFWLVAVLLLMGVGEMWGKTWTWKVSVGVATGSGTATAEIIKCPLIGSESSEKSCSSTSTTLASTSTSEDHTFPSSNTNRKYKYTASPNDGYSFAGWYTSTSVSGAASSTSNPLTGTKTNSGFDQTYYAKYNPVTVNSVSSNPISTSGTALKLTEPGYKTADIKFTVSSNADAKADFNEPTVTGSGWSVDSWSWSGTTVTVTVKYTASNTTSQGDNHTGTVTLTSKANSSISATIYANVDLTPTISASPVSHDFGMFTVGVDSKRSQEFALTVNVNAITLSHNASEPFSASIASDKSKIVVYYEPKAVGAGSWTRTITVTAKNNQDPKLSATQTIIVSGQAQSITYPTYTCDIKDSYMVDDEAIDLQSLWTSTSNGAITYSIEKYTEHGNNNSAGTKPTITNNRYLSLGRACEIKLKLSQASATNYYADSDTKTITISKYETSFSGSEYNLMVDGGVTADYSYTNTSAGQPTANSSNDFYYTVDNVVFTNSATNKGANLVTFDPATKTITACNAGTGKITLRQKETYKYTGDTVSFNVAVYKYNSAFGSAANLNVKVEANDTSGYTLTYSKPNNDYIGTTPIAGSPSLNSGDYYYTLTQSVTATNTEGSADGTIAVAYNAGTKTATGKNAGTCTVKLYQKENYKFNAANTSFDVTVTKNDPVFKWNNNSTTYYHNTTVNNVFSTTNTDFGYTIGASTNAQVAYESDNKLYVLSKNGTASFTVTQAENYKWNGKSVTYSVTPSKQSNHVEFTYTQAMYNDGSITTNKENSAWNSSNQVQLGGTGTADATNWDDKYIIIKFEGIPDKLSFKHCASTNNVSNGWTAYYQADWYVAESSNGNEFTNVWSNMHGENSNSTSWQTINVSNSLSPTTRYIKLCYSGNYAGYFKDIKVTELKKFTPSETTLDFGVFEINQNCADKTFDFNYANVGHNVTLSVDDSHFTVSPTTITNIGGEKTDKVKITVSYSTAAEHKATDAKLTITDELGNKATVTLKGETKKLTPTIDWSTSESIFIEDDELSATNANGLSVALSVAEADEQYVYCEGNTATILGYKAGTITVTATVTGNEIYNDATFTKDITITNLTKQTISWTQDLSHFKTTDETKSITLNGSASSGLAVTYELQGDKTGLSLTQNGNVWTLSYSAEECKNTTLIAKQGGNEEFAPAASVSIPVRVIDPTKVCDSIVTLVSSQSELKNTAVTYNIDIPKNMTVSFSRMKTKVYNIYTVGVDVEFYSDRNGTGSKLYTQSYSASDINKSLVNSTFSLANFIRAKSVRVVTTSTNGYYIDNISYEKRRYCTISEESLSFNTYPNTESSVKTFTVNYANYPISVESSNSKFIVDESEFGDCDEYGTKTISVYYRAGAAEGEDNGYIYIKDNTGDILKTCSLSVSISKLSQSFTGTTIAESYNTTDRVELSAETNSAAAEKHFTYSASPAGIASFDGNVMTFLQSGTIAITVKEEGSDVYKPCTTTVANVVVNKVTPTLTLPTGTNVTYLQNLSASTLSGGKATVTLHGEANTEIAGSFGWSNSSAVANGAAGSNSYEVTFTPEDGGMYNPATGMVAITVNKANQAIVMNNGTVSVAVDKGLDANSADSKLDLTTLIASQTTDALDATRTGTVSYEVIGENSANATISGTIFSATTQGEYTIRATKAATNYYNAATAEFTVTANLRANNLSTVGACTKYVEDEVADAISNVNSDATIQTSSTDASIAYYDIEQNKIVIPNSEAKSFDQTKVTITIWQEATNQFAASGEKTIEVTVKKYDNTLSCDWGSWSKTLNFDEGAFVHFSSNNTAAVNAPIVVEPVTGVENATYYPQSNAIYASHNIGKATWSVYQAENYKYKAAAAMTMTVSVETIAMPSDCYVLNETAEHELYTIRTGEAMELSAPGNQLYFDAKRDATSANYFYIEYSTNGDQYQTLGGEVDLGILYDTYGPYDLPEGTTHIRFKTMTGATLNKYYKNVRVTRKVRLDLENQAGGQISTLEMPLNLVSVDPLNINSSKASFWVDYNTCADEIRIASNHPYYTVKTADQLFSSSATNGVGLREVEVTYTCASADSSSAVISVYTPYEHRTITVTGRTDKGRQEIIWKEPDFVHDTVSLPEGYKGTAATVSSNLPLKYSIEQGEDSVIRISDDKYSFEVVGQGTAHLTVSQEGTATLHPVSGKRVIIGTSKKLQVIRWNQDLTNTLTEGDTVRLRAEAFVMNSNGVYVKDEARTDSIRYSYPENNGVIEFITRDSMRTLSPGETTITAFIYGDAEYVDATSITKLVKVRAINDTCENKMLVERKDTITLTPQIDWGFSNWTATQAVISDSIKIDQSVGKPDKLSFKYLGKVTETMSWYTAKIIKAQQHVRGSWEDVAASAVTPTQANVEGEANDIQLSEDADGIRFVSAQGAIGRFEIYEVNITMLPYLRAPEAIYINAEAGTTVDTTITVQYANAKAALTAKTGRKENDTLSVRTHIYYPNCGTIGSYNWPIRFSSTQVGSWMDSITIKDSGSGDSVVVKVYATVTPGAVFIYETDTTGGAWGDNDNWSHEGALPTANDHVIVKSDVTIPADTTVYVKSISVDSASTVYVNGTLVVMESTPDKKVYGNIHVSENGSLDLSHISEGGLKVNNFILDASLGNVTGAPSASGTVDSLERVVLHGDAYFQMTFDPSGQITYGWYDFVVPFEVNIADGIFRKGETSHLTDGSDFIVMEHSETACAAGQKDWKVYHGVMQPGKVYTITFDNRVTQNTFLFKKKQGSSLLGSSSYEAVCSAGDDDKRGWNGMGNGTLQHKCMLTSGLKIQLYDHTNNIYVLREADEYNFAVGTSFFIQVDEPQTIHLAAAGDRPLMAPRRAGRIVDEFVLSLMDEEAEHVMDMLYFSASEDATERYVIGHDLKKMGTPTEAKVAQMWATKGGHKLCDIESTLVEDNAYAPLTLFAPQAGSYFLAMDATPEDANLYLTKDGDVIWNLSISPYLFDLSKGTTEGYGLLLKAKSTPAITTGVENVQSDKVQGTGAQKVIINDQMYIITPEGAMYHATGKMIR